MSTTSTPQQKFINKDVVYHAAMMLINSNGQTTSLDVKQQLRNMGYWAKQDKVSALLQELQTEHKWNKTDAGGHLEYSVQQAATANTNTTLNDEIIELIKDTINFDDDIDLTSILTIDLGIDHLDIISIGMAIDSKYGIQSVKKDWKDINNVQDVIALVESLIQPTTQSNPLSRGFSTATTQTQSTQSRQTRKKRSVINDSMNPSKNPRVTINIDYKRIVIGPTDAKSQCTPNEWFVSNRNSDPVIYDEKYSSDNVRTAYARLKGIKIQDVRASRVKNL